MNLKLYIVTLVTILIAALLFVTALAVKYKLKSDSIKNQLHYFVKQSTRVNKIDNKMEKELSKNEKKYKMYMHNYRSVSGAQHYITYFNELCHFTPCSAKSSAIVKDRRTNGANEKF